MGNKNIIFNSEEEEHLKNHFESNEINQFNNLIVQKICDKYEDKSTKSWELLMNTLENSCTKDEFQAYISTFPEPDKAILTANALFIILDDILRLSQLL
jgi:hypothetical protein